MPVMHVNSPIGDLTLQEENGAIVQLSFGKRGVQTASTPLLEDAKAQLDAYFQGNRQTFDLPLSLQGTPFQQAVWAQLLQIPYGQTRTYQDIAIAAGSPKAFRAVGQANHVNPIAIFVPCHRVVGKDGSLTGFGGGLDVKKTLLALEKSPCSVV